MAFPIYENLRGFATSRPPIIIFMICLGSFAVVLLTLAYYIKVREITNPDITEDWNMFLENLAHVEFCVLNNSSDSSQSGTQSTTVAVPTTPTVDLSTLELNSTESAAPGIVPENYVNVTVSMLVEIIPTLEFLSIPHNLTHLTTTLPGYQLGLSGDAGNMEMLVTFELPFEWNTTSCSNNGVCNGVKIYTCMTFSAPPNFFPLTRYSFRLFALIFFDIIMYVCVHVRVSECAHTHTVMVNVYVLGNVQCIHVCNGIYCVIEGNDVCVCAVMCKTV
ncbi:Hypothetical predicted protein [Octopus vulgaris]|uniref:TMEM248/TMEM219 domain-containing protein n=1 Tax=Octopus vulgaris TaxID=6645 RepID=A0AA36AG15_OCTVU|nr:Hypothetical predicted protein [Octopus vulgaris]